MIKIEVILETYDYNYQLGENFTNKNIVDELEIEKNNFDFDDCQELTREEVEMLGFSCDKYINKKGPFFEACQYKFYIDIS